jgi:hypothetical protein
MKKIAVKGYVTIKQGDKVLAKYIGNHFVDAGLKGLISTILHAWVRVVGATVMAWRVWYDGWNIYIGSDVVTPTNLLHTGLQNPIGDAPGTAPNTRSASMKEGTADGIWSVTYVATWYAGTVSGTLGETALYMKAPDKATFGWTLSSNYDPPVVMISRLSSADLNFSSFVIDEGLPLTVEWTVQLAFA